MHHLLGKIPNETLAEEWCKKIELVPTKVSCSTHNREAVWYDGPLFGIFRCKGKIKGREYDHQISAAKNTWFTNLKHDVRQRLIITYCFAYSFSFDLTLHEASIVPGKTVSRESVSDVLSYCREVCMASLDKEYEESGMIGGENIIVEIDESKIGRRKYNCGRMVEGSWIIGMVERNEPGYRIEICPDNKRTAEALIPIIKKHILPGTEIHTDL